MFLADGVPGWPECPWLAAGARRRRAGGPERRVAPAGGAGEAGALIP
jgi:hypothetical protein